jgi:hypothetical protein
MITQAKIDANRRNAQKSTGPRTGLGKSIASRNAVTHGLFTRQPVVPGEDEAEFKTFTAHWLEELLPAGALEEFLAERIISIAWRLRRVGQIEARLFQGDNPETHPLSRLSRYEVALERSFYRNLEELRRLQADRNSGQLQNEPTGEEVLSDVSVGSHPDQFDHLTSTGTISAPVSARSPQGSDALAGPGDTA